MEPKNTLPSETCSEYEALLEDYLAGDLAGPQANRVAEHLKSCAGCRDAFDSAAASTRFLRRSAPLLERAADPGPGFVRLVMAQIRAQREHQNIGQPVAAFAWRFAMSASLALALLIAYASQQGGQTNSDLAQLRSGDLFPDPATPATQGDVLRMVADTNHGK